MNALSLYFISKQAIVFALLYIMTNKNFSSYFYVLINKVAKRPGTLKKSGI